jgi:putative flippase GtrA
VKLPPRDRLVKYVAASMCGVVIGQTCLFICLSFLDPVPANVLAVTISTVPAYIINRYWVWAKKDANSLHREILPFWIMSFLGLLLSTFIVSFVDDSDSKALVGLANLSGFGILWVAKFFVLDKFMFGGGPATVEEHLEPPPIL